MEFQTPDNEAIQAGGDFQTPDHEAVGAAGNDEGALMAAGRGALRNFPLAQQAMASLESGPYEENLKGLVSGAESAKAAHPWAYGAGAMVGTAAPAFIPGVAEAPIIGSAITNALQSQSDTNLAKPTMENVQEAGKAGLIGGALGGLGKMFAPVKAALPAEEEAASAVESLAQPAKKAVESVAPSVAQAPRQPLSEVAGMAVPNKKVAADFVPSAERVYASNLAQGLGGTPRQLMRVFGKENPVESLNKIGDWMDTAGPGGKSLHGLLDRPGELLEKIDGIHDSSGKTIGDIIWKIGRNKPGNQSLTGFSDQLLGNLKSSLESAALHTADPGTEARILKLLKTQEHLAENGQLTAFETIQQLKEMAGKQIAKDPEMSQIYGKMADTMDNIIDAHDSLLAKSPLKAAYDKAKLDYHNSSRLLPMLRYAEARELVGGPAGHHTLRGLLSTIINTATATTGLPPVEQLAKNVALKAAPVARNVVNAGVNARGAAGAAVGGLGLKLPVAAQMELANALETKHGKKK